MSNPSLSRLHTPTVWVASTGSLTHLGWLPVFTIQEDNTMCHVLKDTQ